jgi:uncharacterized lipoprotein YmbA
MISRRFPFLILFGFCISLIGLGGCGTSAPTRFYVLSPMPASQEGSQVVLDERCLAIGIGPVTLPQYLERPQIVTRVSSNEMQLADFDQWAEPLKDNFTRVLAENLSALLCADAMAVFPWSGSTPVDYQVQVEVIRLDGAPGGEAALTARWAIMGEDSRKVLYATTSAYRAPVAASEDYSPFVATQSRLVEKFSNDIAEAIKETMLK